MDNDPWPWPTTQSVEQARIKSQENHIQRLVKSIENMQGWQKVTYGKNPCSPAFSKLLDAKIKVAQAEIWWTVESLKFTKENKAP